MEDDDESAYKLRDGSISRVCSNEEMVKCQGMIEMVKIFL